MDHKVHWEQVYTHKLPQQVSWYQAEPKISLQLIEATGYPKNAAIIDVGGGPSTLVDHLLYHRYEDVSVLDISGKAQKHTKARLGEKSRTVQWIEADVTKFNPPMVYDIWHDRAVFHFLTDGKDRKKYVNVLKQSLQKGGHLIVATFAINGPSKCSGLDIVQYDANKIIEELGSGFELQSERFELHITPSGSLQEFNYFHFINRHA